MALNLEPQNGDFQKLAEQLVNQSQTTAELKQSVSQQVDLETTKAKIQSSHQSTLQELRQENAPQNKLQGQSLYNAYSSQEGHAPSSPNQYSTRNPSDSQEQITAKRSASQTAHELHQRPNSASEKAHELHQRSQKASTTAHNLHTQTQDADSSNASSDLFSQSSWEATKHKYAVFVQKLQDNPKLADDPLFMQSLGPLPEYLKPQIEKIVSKLSWVEHTIVCLVSTLISVIITALIIFALIAFYGKGNIGEVPVGLWIVVMILLHPIALKKYKRFKLSKIQGFFYTQPNSSSLEAQKVSHNNPDPTLQNLSTSALGAQASSPTIQKPSSSAFGAQASSPNNPDPTQQNTGGVSPPPMTIPEPPLSFKVKYVLRIVLLMVLTGATTLFGLLYLIELAKTNEYAETAVIIFVLMFFIGGPIFLSYLKLHLQEKMLREKQRVKVYYGKLSFWQKELLRRMERKAKAQKQKSNANATVTNTAQQPNQASSTVNKNNKNPMAWGAFVVSAALTAIFYGAVVKDILHIEDPAAILSILTIAFIIFSAIVTVLFFLMNKSKNNKNATNGNDNGRSNSTFNNNQRK